MNSELPRERIQQNLLILLLIHFVIRAVLAAFTELGNDEAYYWTYARYPDLSHFDHPPFVGWFIQLFTLNLLFENEFSLRLGPLLTASIGLILVYLIGKRINGRQTGFIAALLYSSSIYNSIISGAFILPDGPQLLFWLAAMYCFLLAFDSSPTSSCAKRCLLLAGLFTGLGLLSKYTAVFLWVGAFGYVLFKKREFLRSYWFYLSVLLSFILFLPVIFWNWNNDFVSFGFHGSRVDISRYGFRPDFFFQEVLGEFIYHNPVNFILILVSILFWRRTHSPGMKRVVSRDEPNPSKVHGKNGGRLEPRAFLFWFSMPLISLIIAFSLFRSTLPHWSGPAYLGLIIWAAVFLVNRKKGAKGMGIPWPAKLSAIVFVMVCLLGFVQVRYGALTRLIPLKDQAGELGSGDPSLDLYGWKQLGNSFSQLYAGDTAMGKMSPNPVLLSWRWFPAANQEFYIARPLGLRVLAKGDIGRIHKYYWINDIHGPIPSGSDAYFICSSRDYKNPADLLAASFDTLLPPDTLPVMRAGHKVMENYVYRLKAYHP